jgi:hypothetical protein
MRLLPHLAIASVVVSGATLAVAITRTNAASVPEAVVPVLLPEPPKPPAPAEGKAEKPNKPAAAPSLAVRGVRADAHLNKQRAEIDLEVALGLPDSLAADERLAITARCFANDTWSDARTTIHIGGSPARA